MSRDRYALRQILDDRAILIINPDFLDLLNYRRILCVFYHHVSKICALRQKLSWKDIDTSMRRVYTERR